jgi:hypothetical protein
MANAHNRATNPANKGQQPEGSFGFMRNIPKGYVSNKSFVSDSAFVNACENAGVKPTSRQASKFRAGKGAAYAAKGAK